MENEITLTKTWIRVGAGCGLLCGFIYFTLVTVRLPLIPTAALAALFGPLLAISCIGIYHFIKIHKNTVSLQIGTLSSIIAGVIVNLMLLVQLGTRSSIYKMIDEASEESKKEAMNLILRGIDKIQLTLDVSWDFFISAGMILFAMNMMHHPRLGKAVGILGIVIGSLLLVLNFYTFPVPPATSGLLDLGPLAGGWYLVVIILVLRSFKWVDRTLL